MQQYGKRFYFIGFTMDDIKLSPTTFGAQGKFAFNTLFRGLFFSISDGA
jgi:hypothetical protein